MRHRFGKCVCVIEIQVKCPHCHGSKVVKNGTKKTGRRNFLCRTCGKQFQQEYFYQGADPLVKPQVKSSLLHGSGIRDCNKIYGVSAKCVLRLIINEGKKVKIQPKQKRYLRIQIDELWSFVGKKDKKVWIFYAYAPETKEILAVTMGKRTAKQLRNLMRQIKYLKIKVDYFCTDDFKGFKPVLARFNHLVGKKFTKNIEGVNTAIRSKIARLHRKSTKFSKKLKYHWYLLKIFIFYFNEIPSYI